MRPSASSAIQWKSSGPGLPSPMTRYRWSLPNRHGQWFDNAVEAREDAITHGLATVEAGGNIYLDEMVVIEEERE